jgi:pyruvate dehydrogenase E1 component beta subunit
MPWSRSAGVDEAAGSHPEAAGCDRMLPHAQAIREALEQAMERDPRVFVLGEGVDDPTGIYGTTLGLADRFGPERCFDTPLAENGLTGIAAGAAIGGMRPVFVHNRPDFLLLAMDQLVNHAAKWHQMSGGAVAVPLTIWAAVGRGWGPGAQHSQALHGLFAHTPGLKVAVPASPYDAKGLMLAAIDDPNPVLVLDHRFNFRRRGPVPPEPYRVPLGRAVVRRPGRDATIIAVSHMVTESLAAARDLAAEGVEVEVVDVRSVRPLDREAILAAAARTGRVVVADTSWRTGGIAAELSAMIAEEALERLKAPVQRVANPDVPPPAGVSLERAYYPGSGALATAVRKTLG